MCVEMDAFEGDATSEIDRETAFSAYQAAVEYCCRLVQAFDNDRICESIRASTVERSAM
jgi:hypothetical protein